MMKRPDGSADADEAGQGIDSQVEQEPAEKAQGDEANDKADSNHGGASPIEVERNAPPPSTMARADITSSSGSFKAPRPFMQTEFALSIFLRQHDGDDPAAQFDIGWFRSKRIAVRV